MARHCVPIRIGHGRILLVCINQGVIPPLAAQVGARPPACGRHVRRIGRGRAAAHGSGWGLTSSEESKRLYGLRHAEHLVSGGGRRPGLLGAVGHRRSDGVPTIEWRRRLRSARVHRCHPSMRGAAARALPRRPRPTRWRVCRCLLNCRPMPPPDLRRPASNPVTAARLPASPPDEGEERPATAPGAAPGTAGHE